MEDDYNNAVERALHETHDMLNTAITEDLGRVWVLVEHGDAIPLVPNEQQDVSTYQYTTFCRHLATVAPTYGGEDRDDWDYGLMVSQDAIVRGIVDNIDNASTHIYTTISVHPYTEEDAPPDHAGCTIIIQLTYIVPVDVDIARIARTIYTSMETALTSGNRAHTLRRGCTHPIANATRWTSEFFTEGGIELSANTIMDVMNPLVLDNWCENLPANQDVYAIMVRTTIPEHAMEKFECTLTA